MLNKNTIVIYPAIFAEEDDGIVITFPDLPGCISESDSIEEGVLRAKDALGSWLVANEDLGNPSPKPSAPDDVSLNGNESLFMVDVWLPIYRDEKRSGSVKKSVTVPVCMNTLAERADLNFSQILQAGLKDALSIRDM